jgi:uncharacterized protein (DUF3084 family)
MLKLTSLVLGFLAVVTIAPSSQAATVNPDTVSFGRSVGELHAQMFRREGRNEHREIRNERHHRNERREVRHEHRAARQEHRAAHHEHRAARHEHREGRRHY